MQHTSDIAHEKSVTWLRKKNLSRETELYFIVPQNVIQIDYVGAKINQKSK